MFAEESLINISEKFNLKEKKEQEKLANAILTVFFFC